MKTLLQLDDNYRWQLDGIEFAIPKRVSAPEDFIGRLETFVFTSIKYFTQGDLIKWH